MTQMQCPLASAAARFAKEPAILDDDVCLDYGQLDRIVQSLTARLRHHGVTARDRIAIQAGNSWKMVVSLWALFRIQAVACLISPRWPKSAVDEACKQLAVNKFFDEITLADLLGSTYRMPIDDEDRCVDDRAGE